MMVRERLRKYNKGEKNYSRLFSFRMYHVETCISLIGLSLIRMVRSVENKTDERDQSKNRTDRKNSDTNC